MPSCTIRDEAVYDIGTFNGVWKESEDLDCGKVRAYREGEVLGGCVGAEAVSVGVGLAS